MRGEIFCGRGRQRAKTRDLLPLHFWFRSSDATSLCPEIWCARSHFASDKWQSLFFWIIKVWLSWLNSLLSLLRLYFKLSDSAGLWIFDANQVMFECLLTLVHNKSALSSHLSLDRIPTPALKLSPSPWKLKRSGAYPGGTNCQHERRRGRKGVSITKYDVCTGRSKKNP